MTNARISGATLIVTSLGFVAVFSHLAMHFGYPDVLGGSADHVLPALAAGGERMRAVWAVYALLPSGIAVAATLVFPLLRQRGETRARLGLIAAIVASIAMTAGLLRWPTIQYLWAERFVAAGPDEQRTLATLFDAANLFLGTVTGEFIGELCLSSWFLTLSAALLRGVGTWRWPGYLGLVTAASMAVGAFRNVTNVVEPSAALNNSLLPIWLLALGATLLATNGEGYTPPHVRMVA